MRTAAKCHDCGEPLVPGQIWALSPSGRDDDYLDYCPHCYFDAASKSWRRQLADNEDLRDSSVINWIVYRITGCEPSWPKPVKPDDYKTRKERGLN